MGRGAYRNSRTQSQFSKVGVNSPLHGLAIFGKSTRDVAHGNPVADAFAQRRWLVELTFAQYHFVVAIPNLYVDDNGRTFKVDSERSALQIARRNAKSAYRDLGDLLSCNVVTDTPECRESLGVSGPKNRVEYSDLWHDTSTALPTAA